MNYLKDEKFNCHSILTNLSIEKYMDLVGNAYESNGGIAGQRVAIVTKSGRQIRKQMVDDFEKGAVLPPVVIGIVDDECKLNSNSEQKDLIQYLSKIDKSSISIIDGMQRTTAMKESNLTPDVLKSREIRVEFWIVNSINNLIYRMLVLNTGQVPWNVRRQLEVIFSPIKKLIIEKIPQLHLIEVDDSGRRTKAGEFQANRIIEILHIFSSRSEKFDSKQELSENLQRLDMIESIAKDNIFEMFISLLEQIVQLDINLSQCNFRMEIDGRFKEGKDIFTSQPALVGLVTILSQTILGRPGMDYDIKRIENNYKEMLENFKKFNEKLSRMNSTDMCEFLDLEQLNEIIGKLKGSKVGDVERDFFKSSFKVLIEEKFQLNNFTPCWKS